jgi:hypothetical protein
MPFRFSRRVSTPFGRINISKSGVSLTEGVPGAHVTIGRTPRVTLGIPGSGLSWTETMELGRRRSSAPQSPAQPRSGWTVALIVIGLLVALAIIGSH